MIIDSRIILSNHLPLHYIPKSGAWLSRSNLSDPHLLEHTTKAPTLRGGNLEPVAVDVRPAARLITLVAMVALTVVFVIISLRSQKTKTKK
jgi:hypothetical protein